MPKQIEPQPKREVLTLEESMSHLRIGFQSFKHLMNTQQIVGKKIGRNWRFHVDVLNDYLKRPDQS